MSPLNWFRPDRHAPQSSRMTETTAPFDLRTPLLALSPGDPKQKLPPDYVTIGDACEGIAVIGGTGSGKTTGSGSALAHAFLSHGFGGLVLAAKPEERRLWERYARTTGRAGDLIVFSPSEAWRFNFLDYELRRKGRGGGQTENVVNLLSVVIEIVEGRQQQATGERFWERAGKELLRNAVDLLGIGQGTITLADLCRFVITAPQSKEDVRFGALARDVLLRAGDRRRPGQRPRTRARSMTPKWRPSTGRTITPSLDNRTRSGIVATFTSVADILNHGIGWELLATEITIVPEMTYCDGKLIVLDLPLQEYGELGRIVQGIWKYMFQRAVLRTGRRPGPPPGVPLGRRGPEFRQPLRLPVPGRGPLSTGLHGLPHPEHQLRLYAVLGGNGKDEAKPLLGNFRPKSCTPTATTPPTNGRPT